VNALAGRVLRVLVAAALTAFVLWRSDPGAVVGALLQAKLSYVLLAVLLVIVDRALMAWRWVALLCTIGTDRPPIGRLMRIFFVSTFLGTFLPASVGGDALRAYGLSREQVGSADAAASVLMDRILGLASIVFVGIVSLFFARDLAGDPAIVGALSIVAVVCGAAMLVVFSERAAGVVVRMFRLERFHLFERFLVPLLTAVRQYARYHRQLLNVLLASIAVQILRVIQAYLLGRALGIDASLLVYFAFVPLILLVMLLPITINGLGTSQAAFVWFFARAGVPAPPAFALSVLFVALGVVGNLPGGALYAMKTARV
jgi:uncharacterized protein (TIRG00374 family)